VPRDEGRSSVGQAQLINVLLGRSMDMGVLDSELLLASTAVAI
jgi:hypothetical protein